LLQRGGQFGNNYPGTVVADENPRSRLLRTSNGPSDKLLRAVTVSRGLFPILYCITTLTPYNRENRARSGRVEEQGARWAREVLLSSLSVRELFYALSEQSAVDVAGAMQDADDLNACRNDAIENEVGEFDQGAGFGAYVRPSGT
jgi:hypothetical protein